MARRIRFGGEEHQRREIHALHRHYNAGFGYYGNGATVMVVCKPRAGGAPFCEVIGEDGLDSVGESFRYEDYFLPEELVARPAA